MGGGQIRGALFNFFKEAINMGGGQIRGPFLTFL